MQHFVTYTSHKNVSKEQITFHQNTLTQNTRASNPPRVFEPARKTAIARPQRPHANAAHMPIIANAGASAHTRRR